MTSGMVWGVLLLGLVVQGVVIYGAIRLALVHDRVSRVRESAKVKAAASWKTRADEARVTAEAKTATNRPAT